MAARFPPAELRPHDRDQADRDQQHRPPLAQPADRQQVEVVGQKQGADDDEDDAAPAHDCLRKWSFMVVQRFRQRASAGGRRKAPHAGPSSGV